MSPALHGATLLQKKRIRMPRISRPSKRLGINLGLASFALIVPNCCLSATHRRQLSPRPQLAIADFCSLSVFLRSFIRRAFLDNIAECSNAADLGRFGHSGHFTFRPQVLANPFAGSPILTPQDSSLRLRMDSSKFPTWLTKCKP